MFRSQMHFFAPNIFRLKRRALMVGVFLAFLLIELGVGSQFLINRPYLLALPLAPLVIFYFSAQLDQTVVAIIFCMLAVKIGISTGTATKLPISLLLTGLWLGLWLVKMAFEQNIRFIPTKINLPALIFLVIVIVSWLWSGFFLDPQVVISGKFLNVQLGTIGVTLISVVLPILCINILRKVSQVRICYWLVVAGSAFYLPFYIYETTFGAAQASGRGDEISLTTLSRLVNAGGLFPMWFCCLTLALLLFDKTRTKGKTVLLVIVLLGWLFRLFVITLVRISGWLPALVAMLVVLFLYSRKWFIILCIVAAVLLALNFDLVYSSIVVSKEKEGTLAGETSRGSLLGQALQVAQLHPILGTGPAGYANYYLTYFRDLALSTHNNYLDMILQYGSLGLISFMWLCFAMIMELWKAIKVQPEKSFEKAFVVGSFAGACGMMPAMWLGDWVIPFAYNQTIAGFSYTGYNWLFIGLALALGNIAREKLR